MSAIWGFVCSAQFFLCFHLHSFYGMAIYLFLSCSKNYYIMCLEFLNFYSRYRFDITHIRMYLFFESTFFMTRINQNMEKNALQTAIHTIYVYYMYILHSTYYTKFL